MDSRKKPSNKTTHLHAAALGGHPDSTASQLIANFIGAEENINPQNESGNTPFMSAIETDYEFMVNELLSYDHKEAPFRINDLYRDELLHMVDMTILNDEGKNCFDIAIEKGELKVFDKFFQNLAHDRLQLPGEKDKLTLARLRNYAQAFTQLIPERQYLINHILESMQACIHENAIEEQERLTFIAEQQRAEEKRILQTKKYINQFNLVLNNPLTIKKIPQLLNQVNSYHLINQFLLDKDTEGNTILHRIFIHCSLDAAKIILMSLIEATRASSPLSGDQLCQYLVSTINNMSETPLALLSAKPLTSRIDLVDLVALLSVIVDDENNTLLHKLLAAGKAAEFNQLWQNAIQAPGLDQTNTTSDFMTIMDALYNEKYNKDRETPKSLARNLSMQYADIGLRGYIPTPKTPSHVSQWGLNNDIQQNVPDAIVTPATPPAGAPPQQWGMPTDDRLKPQKVRAPGSPGIRSPKVGFTAKSKPPVSGKRPQSTSSDSEHSPSSSSPTIKVARPPISTHASKLTKKKMKANLPHRLLTPRSRLDSPIASKNNSYSQSRDSYDSSSNNSAQISLWGKSLLEKIKKANLEKDKDNETTPPNSNKNSTPSSGKE